MSRGGTTLYVTVSSLYTISMLPLSNPSLRNETKPKLTLHSIGLRTRHTSSRTSVRIRTVCQPDVDMSMIALDHLSTLPPRPSSSSSSRLRCHLHSSASCDLYPPNPRPIERSHNVTNIGFTLTAQSELRRIERSSFLASSPYFNLFLILALSIEQCV